MQWSNSLTTGVGEIDSQHKELIDRVNKLLEACNHGKGKEEVGGIIKFLEDYVVTHFGAEERFMAGTPILRPRPTSSNTPNS